MIRPLRRLASHAALFAAAVSAASTWHGCGRLGFDASDAVVNPPADAGDPDAVSTAPATLFVGVQGVTDSYVYRLGYDPDAALLDRVTKIAPPTTFTSINGSRIRGLTRYGDLVLAGSGGGDSVLVSLASTMPVDGDLHDIGPELRNAHGMCALPGGNLVIGEYIDDPGAQVAEFRPTIDGFDYIGPMYSTRMPAGTLTYCHATDDDTLYLTDQNATTDRGGHIVRLERSEDGWFEAARLELTDLHPDTSAYSFVVTDALYAFPLRRFGAIPKGVIRCPLVAGQDWVGTCDVLGDLPEDLDDEPNGPGAIQGAVALADQIVFATNTALYAYDVSADRWDFVYDLRGGLDDLVDDAGAPDQLAVVRNLVLFER